jgi:hypothetical protein
MLTDDGGRRWQEDCNGQIRKPFERPKCVRCWKHPLARRKPRSAAHQPAGISHRDLAVFDESVGIGDIEVYLPPSPALLVYRRRRRRRPSEGRRQLDALRPRSERGGHSKKAKLGSVLAQPRRGVGRPASYLANIDAIDFAVSIRRTAPPSRGVTASSSARSFAQP